MFKYEEHDEWDNYLFRIVPPHHTVNEKPLALKPEVFEWLDENARNDKGMPLSTVFYTIDRKMLVLRFYNKELALRFKLAWG